MGLYLFCTCASFVEPGKLSNRLILGYTLEISIRLLLRMTTNRCCGVPVSFQLIELIELHLKRFRWVKNGAAAHKMHKSKLDFSFHTISSLVVGIYPVAGNGGSILIELF